MGRRGPKPMPTAVRLAKGTAWRHPERINKAEPKPAADQVAAPVWLLGEAREMFDRLAPQLLNLGLVTNFDCDALGRYCLLHCELVRHALACQRGEEAIVYRDSEGRVKHAAVSPSATMVTKLAPIVLRLAESFGMTPSSRSQLVAGAGQEQTNPLQQWLADWDAKEQRKA